MSAEPIDESDLLWLLSDKPEPPVYRIAERDNRRGPKTTLAVGMRISFSRIVHRVGYAVGAHSITPLAWYNAGLEIIARDSGIPLATVRAVIAATQNSHPFKFIGYRIYDERIRPLIQTQAPETRDVRAMWFRDIEGRGTILKIVRKVTGKRDPGGSVGDDGDYEPPCLYATHVQQLYVVAHGFENVLVYPDDARTM